MTEAAHEEYEGGTKIVGWVERFAKPIVLRMNISGCKGFLQ
jgi:hypothetical protein